MLVLQGVVDEGKVCDKVYNAGVDAVRDIDGSVADDVDVSDSWQGRKCFSCSM